MPRNPITDLGLSIPVIAAPMAGGPTTPELVIAAAAAGGLGFLAGGYQTAATLGAQIAVVSGRTGTFGVNLFAPNPIPVDNRAYLAYRAGLTRDAERFGVTLPEIPVDDDDHWREKIDLLLDHPVPLVSFTFGIPDHPALAALRAAGSLLVQTVTSTAEAQRAAAAGLDALVVQSAAAGGHSGTFTPERETTHRPLVDLIIDIRHAVDLPVLAAGAVAGPDQVENAIRCGAAGVLVGTALLLAAEAGTSSVHRLALTDGTRGATVVTRAFTGRPARALPNTFIRRHGRTAPLGYPAVHYLTSPLRRAAAAAQDPEFVNLWAGEGYREIRDQPAVQTLRWLAGTG